MYKTHDIDGCGCRLRGIGFILVDCHIGKGGTSYLASANPQRRQATKATGLEDCMRFTTAYSLSSSNTTHRQHGRPTQSAFAGYPQRRYCK